MRNLYDNVPVVPIWFIVVVLLMLGGSALMGLGGLAPEDVTELAVLFPLCGGMGTGPLWGAGARGSITLGTVQITVKIK